MKLPSETDPSLPGESLFYSRQNVSEKDVIKLETFDPIKHSIYYGWDWVPELWVPKGNTRTRTKFWVWVGLGLCLNSMGIFGLGTHKVQNFGFFWVLPTGTREDWVPKIWAPKGNTQTVLL